MVRTFSISHSASLREPNVVPEINCEVRRKRPSMSWRKFEGSHTPASASGCKACSIKALIPPINMLLKSPWTCQLTESGPNRPGSPLGFSRSSWPSDRPVRLISWVSIRLRINSMATRGFLAVQAFVDQAIHDAGVGQCRGVTQAVQFIAGDFAQNPPHDLAGSGFRQGRRPLDQFRLGKAADFLADQLKQVFLQRIAGFNPIHWGDEGINPLAFDVVGIAHHGGFGHLVMQHQRAFYLGSADAVAGHVDHIVDAPSDPVVTVLIAACAVPREVVARVGFEIGVDHALRVAVDAANLPRPAGLDCQYATAGAADWLALLIQQHRLHAKNRLGCAAGLDPLGADQGAEHDAAGFGLPPRVDNRAALFTDGVEVPVPGFGVDRLADTAQQAQAGAR